MTHASFVEAEAERRPGSLQADDSAAAAAEDPASSAELRSLKAARRMAIDRFEVEYLRALLRRSEGNVTRAAEFAQVSRQVIHKLIAKHRL